MFGLLLRIDMAFDRKKIKEDLKKSIYRAVSKAYRQNVPFVRQAVDGMKGQHAVNHIMADINDSNNVAQVPDNDIPVDKQNVLHKDIPDVKQMHDAKEAQAKAQLGVMPIGGQKGAVNMSEAPTKGVERLRKFIGDRQAKMAKGKDVSEAQRMSPHGYDGEKGVHIPVSVHTQQSPTKGDAKEKSYMGIQARRGDTEGAKSTSRGTLDEQRKMKAPNLGKKETGHEKGVHSDMSSHGYGEMKGQSKAGLHSRSAIQSKKTNYLKGAAENYHKVSAKEAHQKKLAELKAMPSPKLGKSKK